MVILGLDTTTAAGSVALSRNGELLETGVGDPARTHGERLPGDLLSLLDRHGLAIADVDAYTVCCGPGSFTGLRVGLATIQGLALVNRRPVVPVPTLEALAWAAVWELSDEPPPDGYGAWMNAHRGEVFAALYGRPAGPELAAGPDQWGPLPPVTEPTVGRPDRVAEQWQQHRPSGQLVLIGDAVGPHRHLLEAALGASSRFLSDVPPLAGVACRIANRAMKRGEGVSPYAVRPVYVRRPDAELARERRRSGAGTSSR